jgi:hypothetical protein
MPMNAIAPIQSDDCGVAIHPNALVLVGSTLGAGNSPSLLNVVSIYSLPPAYGAPTP